MTHGNFAYVDEKMNSYRAKVKNAASLKNGEPIFNESISHAAILVEELVGSANEQVKILTGELNPRVFASEDVMEQFRLFLADPEHKVRILVEDFTQEDLEVHPIITEFGNTGRIELKKVPADVQKTYDFHLLVADGESYRFEQDKTKSVAVAAFGHPKGGQNLDNVFDQLWDKSTEFPPK